MDSRAVVAVATDTESSVKNKWLTMLAVGCSCILLSACTEKATLTVIADKDVCWEVSYNIYSDVEEFHDWTDKLGCGPATISIPPNKRPSEQSYDRYFAYVRQTDGDGELAISLVLANQFTDSDSTTQRSDLMVSGSVDD